MNSEIFKKSLEFNEAIETARNAKKNVLKTAEDVLRAAYEQNDNKPVSFESTCLGNDDNDLIGEYNTLSFDNGELCLSHSEYEDLKCPELEWICYDDLQSLVKAIVNAVE